MTRPRSDVGGPESDSDSDSIQIQVEMQIQHTPKSGLIARVRLSLSNLSFSVSFGPPEGVSFFQPPWSCRRLPQCVKRSRVDNDDDDAELPTTTSVIAAGSAIIKGRCNKNILHACPLSRTHGHPGVFPLFLSFHLNGNTSFGCLFDQLNWLGNGCQFGRLWRIRPYTFSLRRSQGETHLNVMVSQKEYLI